jgi:hypothetical protein
MSRDLERAIARREFADARVRSLTVVAAVAGTGLTVALAAYAGVSTHVRKVISRPRVTSPRAQLVVAPAAPLVPVGPAASSGQAAPPSTPAPAPAYSPPVAVSGGS